MLQHSVRSQRHARYRRCPTNLRDAAIAAGFHFNKLCFLLDLPQATMTGAKTSAAPPTQNRLMTEIVAPLGFKASPIPNVMPNLRIIRATLGELTNTESIDVDAI